MTANRPLSVQISLRWLSAAAVSLVGLGAAAGLLAALRAARPVEAGPALSYSVIQRYLNPDPTAADSLGGEEFGSALAYLPDEGVIVVGARGDQLAGTVPYGAAYLLDNSGAVIHQLKKPEPVQGDYFGFSVAAAGNNVVIGAPRDDRGSSASNYGAAYLFDLSTGALVFTYTHAAPSNQDQFGYALAILSDTLVVGVPEHNTPSPNAGRVYLCSLTTGDCPDDNLLGNPTPGSNGRFGHSLAVVGSYIAVGAPLDGPSGRVFIYAFNGVTATLAYTITASGSGRDFGWTLAPAGDRLLIGSPADDTGANNAGSAYLYDLTGTPVYTFTNPSPDDNDRFGTALAADDHFITIGAPNDDDGADNAGAVHLFDAATFSFVATVQASTRTADAQFGIAVVNDSNGEVLVGAFDTVDNVTGSGAVHRLGLQTDWRLYLPVVLR